MKPAPVNVVKKINKKPSRLVILIAVAVVVSLGISVYLLVTPSGKKQFSQLSGKPQAPQITLKTESKNPFDKETQYVNPFDASKSPFYALKNKAQTK